VIKYKNHQYREAAAAAVIDDAYWRHAALRFWIIAVVRSKTGTDLPAPAKQLRAKTWQKIPHLIRQGVGQDADVQQRILNACADGTCQYIYIDMKGWLPGQRRGTRDTQQVQQTLEWIEQFRNKTTVGGSQLIWAEVGSNVQRR